jgi:hypothetical protein
MFRFTIRELVLLTLVVAMGVGWWLDSRSNRIALDALRNENAIMEALQAVHDAETATKASPDS